ncbi:PD-(D/E)XK nuclease family protein [Limnobacter sp.]|uniref:PD-(D/E)XK nuclease family protein n=1 Tax=Limnobacter sp. TaxID=2003368 RepID=UPI0025BA7DB7|nr:PD-(D/E)XK nuclease family protein [Limnobacter sp.]
MSNEAQHKLSKLGKSSLVRDDSGSFRVYRDDAGGVFHSVTHILGRTAPDHQKKALERWLARPGSEQDRETAATRGTLAHNHAEYILKTGAQLARKAANKRNVWKTHSDGLERCPGSITSWGIERAIQGAPRVPWSAAGYARGLRGWIGKNVTAIHSVEFSIHHPAGFAGTCDALLDIQGEGPIIVDWKTSQRERSEEMLVNYQDQLGAYSLGLRKLTGIRAKGGVIVVARRTGAPQIRTLSDLEVRGCESRFLERVDQYFSDVAT